MDFDYCLEQKFLGLLEIEDVGKCCIEANNDEGFFYYLIVKTRSGQSEVLEYGPIVPDIDTLPDDVSCNYTKFDFSKPRLKKLIFSFLNNPRKQITQAKTITIEEFSEVYKNLLDKFIGE